MALLSARRQIPFLDGPVHEYFLSQSLVELGNPWPFGQWSHGATGRLEYYQWLFGTSDVAVVACTLKVQAKLDFKPHVTCPCSSRRRIRDCCWARIRELRSKIPPEVALAAMKSFRTATDSQRGAGLTEVDANGGLRRA